MKYAVPTDDGKTVGAVFGRARNFAIREDEGPIAIVPNEGAASEHGAGTGAAAFLAEQGVGVVLAPEVGPKAAAALAAAGMRAERVKAGMAIGDALDEIR